MVSQTKKVLRLTLYCTNDNQIKSIFAYKPIDMSCAHAHLVGSKPIRRVVQLKLHKPTMAVGYSLSMCARHVDSTNPGQSNLVFRSKPIPEAEMSNQQLQR